MKVKKSYRRKGYSLHKQERIDSDLDRATDAWLQAASRAGHKPAKARWTRRPKRRVDSLPGIVTEPTTPIEPYTGDKAPWEE